MNNITQKSILFCIIILAAFSVCCLLLCGCDENEGGFSESIPAAASSSDGSEDENSGSSSSESSESSGETSDEGSGTENRIGDGNEMSDDGLSWSPLQPV